MKLLIAHILCLFSVLGLSAQPTSGRPVRVVSSKEDVRVFVDGKEVGMTPYLSVLTCDSHWFYGIHDGLHSAVERIRLKDGPGDVPFIELVFHDYVDLGLPSGTLWATCNVGAKAPEDFGDYFAWGETRPVNEHTSDNYTFQTKYTRKIDPAVILWGADWCLPTVEQFRELIDKHFTVCTWTELNGVGGYRIKSLKNDNSIFLPAAGFSHDEKMQDVGSVGSYWSQSTGSVYLNGAYQLFFYVEDTDVNLCDRFYGRNIRPVVGKN